MNWDLLAKITASVVTFVVPTIGFLNKNARLRSAIMSDLDLLSKLNKQSTAFSILNAHIEGEVRRLCGLGAPGKVVDWDTLVGGLVLLSGFGLWTYFLVDDGFTWWALATGSVALTGFFMALGSVNSPDQKAANIAQESISGEECGDRRGGA